MDEPRDAKCAKLTVEQADNLFFPGSGGKPHRAKRFCRTCPLISECLQEALRYKSAGFVAGTTEDERRSMKQFNDNTMAELDIFLPKITGKRVYRKMIRVPDVHSWMDDPNLDAVM